MPDRSAGLVNCICLKIIVILILNMIVIVMVTMMVMVTEICEICKIHSDPKYYTKYVALSFQRLGAPKPGDFPHNRRESGPESGQTEDGDYCLYLC